ncbi:MAG: Hsp20 family protein [Candidatus Moranbacteria bacterium]|nr:Hsp20 family protein [Candidatus Moranbacteria bacterium]
MTKEKNQKNKVVPAYSLRDAMSRLFNESVWDPFASSGNYLTDWGSDFPKVDIKETKDSLKVNAEVAGVDPKDINIEVENEDYMILSGEIKEESKEEEENIYKEERYIGKFRREFSLPTKVDSSKIKAKIKDGILRITLPKSRKSKAQKIDIERE